MSKRILIVEDETAILLTMRLCLEKAGFEVITAQTGAEGLRAALSELPDLVLLDLRLPEMSGFLVLEALRDNERTKTIPVVISSARVQESDRKRVEELGADDFLAKPFTPGELLEKVNSHIGQ